MGIWEGSPRATVPTQAMQDSPDVQSPTQETAASSQGPFGLGFYMTPPTDTPTALPLFYVSPWAAAQRSPSTDPQNAPGVHPGWYVLAAPNQPFVVRISRVNDTLPGRPEEQYMSTRMYVDGVSTNCSKVFCRSHPREEATERGFVDSDLKGDLFNFKRRIRPFSFSSAVSADGSETKTKMKAKKDEIGTVRIEVKVGVPVRRNPAGFVSEKKHTIPLPTTVSEKTAAKEGRSLRVTVRQEVVEEKCRRSTWTTNQKRVISAAGVTVIVRERAWLRSRRIIDDKDQPCTGDMFQRLLKQDRAQSNVIVVTDEDEEEKKRARKRVKRMPVLVDADEWQGDASTSAGASGIIDLT